MMQTNGAESGPRTRTKRMSSYSYSHTLTVRKGHQVFSPVCSFHSEPLQRGNRWTVHKGLFVHHFRRFAAVVKFHSNPCVRSAATEVHAEVKKLSFAQSVLEANPVLGKAVECVPTFHSAVDKVGRWCRLLKKFHASSDNNDSLREDAPVLVQTFVDGQVKEHFALDFEHAPTSQEAAFWLSLVHESYRQSKGQCVITGVKGVESRHDNGAVTYRVTSLTVHSRAEMFGEKDLGTKGVEAYEQMFSIPSPDQLHENHRHVFPLEDRSDGNSRGLPTRLTSTSDPQCAHLPDKMAGEPPAYCVAMIPTFVMN